MNSTELIAATRLSAFIDDNDLDFKDAIILKELNTQLSQTFSRAIVNARNGYWLKQAFILPITPGISKYQMPQRSVTGGLERIDMADATLRWSKLDEVDDEWAQIYDQGLSQGPVTRYVVRGDNIQLLPLPDNNVYNLRFSYYIRPSLLQSAQSSSSTVRGLITAVNTSTRQLTVNVIPYDETATTPAAMVSGTDLIDVVRPTGWSELQLVGASQTYSGLVITVGGTDDMSTIRVGDYVRVAEQTDWPALPPDFHQALCDAAAVKIMLKKNMIQKASALAESVAGDLQRFGDLISPRVQDSARTIHMPVGLYRGARRYTVAKYP